MKKFKVVKDYLFEKLRMISEKKSQIKTNENCDVVQKLIVWQGAKGKSDVQCYKCDGFGHVAANCNADGGKGTKGKGKGMQCYSCNGFGHKSSDCPRGTKRKSDGNY